jgi:hypothetical protein
MGLKRFTLFFNFSGSNSGINIKIEPSNISTHVLYLIMVSACMRLRLRVFSYCANSNNILKMVDFQRQRKPKLFWVSAMAPMVVVVLGCLLAYFTRDSKYSIQTVN